MPDHHCPQNKTRNEVWPVAMGKYELLVEWEDGTLGTAKLWDIRMVKE